MVDFQGKELAVGDTAVIVQKSYSSGPIQLHEGMIESISAGTKRPVASVSGAWRGVTSQNITLVSKGQ